jgi:hypothetical protein
VGAGSFPQITIQCMTKSLKALAQEHRFQHNNRS